MAGSTEDEIPNEDPLFRTIGRIGRAADLSPAVLAGFPDLLATERVRSLGSSGADASQLAKWAERALRDAVSSIVDRTDRLIGEAMLGTRPPFAGVASVATRRSDLQRLEGVHTDTYKKRRKIVVRRVTDYLRSSQPNVTDSIQTPSELHEPIEQIIDALIPLDASLFICELILRSKEWPKDDEDQAHAKAMELGMFQWHSHRALLSLGAISCARQTYISALGKLLAQNGPLEGPVEDRLKNIEVHLRVMEIESPLRPDQMARLRNSHLRVGSTLDVSQLIDELTSREDSRGIVTRWDDWLVVGYQDADGKWKLMMDELRGTITSLASRLRRELNERKYVVLDEYSSATQTIHLFNREKFLAYVELFDILETDIEELSAHHERSASGVPFAGGMAKSRSTDTDFRDLYSFHTMMGGHSSSRNPMV